ncbi:MAG: N-acetylmuramoyl-L-alanine amidase [Clostridiales bacterium]|nr:N-acetylmuramoyl-L-alanine amidase [Clostridiales bacterium]
MAFVTVRKRTLIIILSVVIAIVAVVATAAAVITAARADNGITIVIDAGHGGIDGGVVGVKTGTKESDINLSISNYLMKYFKDAGYNVVMTRNDSGAAMSGLKYNKREDMRARRDVVERAAPDLVISVHCNSYPQGSVNGAQAFYSSGASVGKQYAEVLQSYFNDTLNSKPRSAAVGDYYILNCTEYPSVLCECGFLSNAQEEAKLTTASYQEKVAYTIFSAVNSVFYDKA